MKDLKKLFKILKDKRIEKAYSFRQLENILNGRDQKISYSTLQKLENGEFNAISIELLTELCKIYNLNYIKMLELSGADKRLLNPNQESNIKSIEEVERLELPVYGIASAGSSKLYCTFFIFRNFFIFSVDNYKQIVYTIINTVNKVFEQEDDMTYKDVRVLMIKKNKSYNDLIGNVKNSRGEPYTTLQGLWRAMTKGKHKEEVCERVVSFLLQS